MTTYAKGSVHFSAVRPAAPASKVDKLICEIELCILVILAMTIFALIVRPKDYASDYSGKAALYRAEIHDSEHYEMARVE